MRQEGEETERPAGACRPESQLFRNSEELLLQDFRCRERRSVTGRITSEGRRPQQASAIRSPTAKRHQHPAILVPHVAISDAQCAAKGCEALSACSSTCLAVGSPAMARFNE